MKIFVIILVTLVSNNVLACGDVSVFEFGGYSVPETKSKPYGESVTVKNNEIKIRTEFLDNLLKNPTGSNLDKNREELFYLVARSNEKAVLAGLKILNHLISHPEYSYDCDSKHEKWNKEEVAFVVSRSWVFHEQLCNIESKERVTILSFYENHPMLYGMVYDPPWMEGNLSCEK